MKTIAFALVAALALAAGAEGAAAAETPAWGMPAAGCQIAEGRDVAEVSGASVRFAAGKTGAIRLVCPVTHARFGIAGLDANLIGGLVLTYQDSTGADGSAIVAVDLVKTPFATGVPSVVGRIDSDTVGLTLPSMAERNLASAGFQLDFAAGVYHVEVTLKRSSPVQAVSVTALALTKPFLRFNRTF